MDQLIKHEGRVIAYIGYDNKDMIFTYSDDSIPSFTIPIEKARAAYPAIFAQLSPVRIAKYEHAVMLVRGTDAS